MLIVIALIGVLAGIAALHSIAARMSANRASAISSLETIHRAQDAFRVLCGGGSGYAGRLEQLAQAQLISPDLGADGVKSGYTIAMAAAGTEGQPTDRCTGEPVAASWYASAVPVAPGQTGHSGFATDQDHGVWEETTGKAPAQPFAESDTARPVEQ